MLNDNQNRLLICILCIILHRMGTAQDTNDLTTKVSLLLHVQPENPKCFAEGWRDLVCFWEEDEERARSPNQYTFTYTYQNENSSRCDVTSLPAEGSKRLFLCHLSKIQLFVPLDIKVHRDGVIIHNRTLTIEENFLLSPPTNLTLNSTERQGQLRVSWRPPAVKYMGDSMMYEVSYAVADSHMGQVETVKASSALVLRGLQPGTRYKVQVRVKLEGAYSGYWSAWTNSVFMDTLPSDLDVLIVSLSLIITVILTLLFLAGLMSYRSLLLKKIWPVIPTPDSKFEGLFTVYGGDFQEWLGNTSGGLWLTPPFFYPDEVAAPLEVLSELSLGPPHPGPAPALPPKTSAVVAAPAKDGEQQQEEEDEDKRRLQRADSALAEEEGWRDAANHDRWLMEQLRAPRSQSSLLESQDAYVTLDARHPPRASAEEDPPLDDIAEETLPLQVLFASGGTDSDLGSLPQSSVGSGRLSSQSSFEYPNQAWPSNHAWLPKGPGYIYMAVADSGVSMDYSPMSSSRTEEPVGKGPVYTNEYKNEIPRRRQEMLAGQPVRSWC